MSTARRGGINHRSGTVMFCSFVIDIERKKSCDRFLISNLSNKSYKNHAAPSIRQVHISINVIKSLICKYERYAEKRSTAKKATMNHCSLFVWPQVTDTLCRTWKAQHMKTLLQITFWCTGLRGLSWGFLFGSIKSSKNEIFALTTESSCTYLCLNVVAPPRLQLPLPKLLKVLLHETGPRKIPARILACARKQDHVPSF